MNLYLFDKRKLRIRLEGGERAGRAVSLKTKESLGKEKRQVIEFLFLRPSVKNEVCLRV